MVHSEPVVNCGGPMSVIRLCLRPRSILPYWYYAYAAGSEICAHSTDTGDP